MPWEGTFSQTRMVKIRHFYTGIKIFAIWTSFAMRFRRLCPLTKFPMDKSPKRTHTMQGCAVCGGQSRSRVDEPLFRTTFGRHCPRVFYAALRQSIFLPIERSPSHACMQRRTAVDILCSNTGFIGSLDAQEWRSKWKFQLSCAFFSLTTYPGHIMALEWVHVQLHKPQEN